MIPHHTRRGNIRIVVSSLNCESPILLETNTWHLACEKGNERERVLSLMCYSLGSSGTPRTQSSRRHMKLRVMKF
ncbi:hypothetical protein SCLCIDRAFT_1212840 [Scleroderma citrinum Foug A]|uniref:Uncharacterized protein n=1 Tax=Scleroderma citrinum Foug A TaxID=1036808 RepID=A0A0C3E8Q0_9AGAM|nr:hypothetical protein SCLCIDRAFT_1212840 [Scleroderma citrinum Foug A]